MCGRLPSCFQRGDCLSNELIFIKLGGSLITDKHVEARYRSEIVRAIGESLYQAKVERPDLRFLLGHGSGSFGHMAAARYGTRDGVRSGEEWRGFVEVASAAAELHRLVYHDLRECHLPVMSIQPSASVLCEKGSLVAFNWLTLRELISRGLIPLIYGDVSLDVYWGGTIASTEEIFSYLVQPLAPNRILLLGEVDGVYDEGGEVIRRITPANYHLHAGQLGDSSATDVTGGMFGKVKTMLDLVELNPTLQVHILDGADQKAFLAATLQDTNDLPGTLISAS